MFHIFFSLLPFGLAPNRRFLFLLPKPDKQIKLKRTKSVQKKETISAQSCYFLISFAPQTVEITRLLSIHKYFFCLHICFALFWSNESRTCREHASTVRITVPHRCQWPTTCVLRSDRMYFLHLVLAAEIHCNIYVCAEKCASSHTLRHFNEKYIHIKYFDELVWCEKQTNELCLLLVCTVYTLHDVNLSLKYVCVYTFHCLEIVGE